MWVRRRPCRSPGVKARDFTASASPGQLHENGRGAELCPAPEFSEVVPSSEDCLVWDPPFFIKYHGHRMKAE